MNGYSFSLRMAPHNLKSNLSSFSFFPVKRHGRSNIGNEKEFSTLITAYCSSPEWAALSEKTRYVWRFIVDRILARWGETPLSAWSDTRQLQAVLAWRNERAHQPRTADHQVTVLHHLLAWGRLHGWVSVNIASGIPQLYRTGTRAEIIWLETEISAFCAHAPLAVSDGMRLASLTGLRRADLIGLRWDEVDQLRIKRVTLKSRHRRKHALIPITRELRILLDELRNRPRSAGVNTVLVNSRGRSWTGDGFGHQFNAVRNALQIRHIDGRLKHLHDVRGTYATRLVAFGLTDQEIGDIMGWSAQQVGDIRKIYVEDDTAVQAIIDRMQNVSPVRRFA